MSLRSLSCLAALAASALGLLGASAPGALAADAGTQRPAAVTYSLVTEPDAGYQPIYDFMNSATTSLDMTMYELTDTTAEHDLTALAAHGVTVRVILDQNREKSHNQAAYTYLSGNGVSVHWANPAYEATHQKSIVVDDSKVAIMTGNLTSQYYASSRDFAVLENNSYDVNAVEKVFAADFVNGTITPTDGDHLVWSPTDSQTQLLAVINSAKTTLSVENEEMGLPAATTALENAAKRGVDVQVTMTNTANDYASEFDALTAAGVHVHTYAEDDSRYIHAKVLVVDAGLSDQQVAMTSQNFSDASWNHNRELGFISTSAPIISGINTAVASDYAGGTAWTTS